MFNNTPALLRRVISWPTRRTPIILSVLSRLVVQLSKRSTISPSPRSVEISVSVVTCGLCIYVCVCVLVTGRTRARERERQRQRQTTTESGGGSSSSTAITRTMPECVCLFGEPWINPINTYIHAHTHNLKCPLLQGHLVATFSSCLEHVDPFGFLWNWEISNRLKAKQKEQNGQQETGKKIVSHMCQINVWLHKKRRGR